MTQPTPDRKPLAAHVHPDDRSRIDTLNALAKQFHGAPKEKAPLSYYSPILIQCTLPHSDPKARDWKKTNGDVTLIVSSGVDKNLVPYGVPYGSFPRLVLAYIITSVVQTGERRIELAAHFGSFLKEIGYTGNYRGNTSAAKAIKSQMDRLLNATIAFTSDEGTEEYGEVSRGKVDITKGFVLWWDYRNPNQGSLWGSYIELTEDFLQSVLRAPVPLLNAMLAAVKKSPLAIDLYMWLSYRLFTMQASGQNEISLSYGRLQGQFGTGMAEKNYRNFRSRFKKEFADVAEAWNKHAENERQHLKYELGDTGLTLFRSDLLIAKAKPSATEQEAQRLLSRRRFDDATRKEARQLAGSTWSVEYLETQYFDWIGKKGITPKDPKTHFFDFIKTHRERNG